MHINSFLDPPEVTKLGEGKCKVNEANNVTLICGYDLQSNPRATITWINPSGNKVLATENYSQDDGPGVVQLHIKRANRTDRGQWTCKMEVPDVNVCMYNCLDDKKLLNSGQNGQQLQANYCSRKHKSLTNNYIVDLDVFCKCKFLSIGLPIILQGS